MGEPSRFFSKALDRHRSQMGCERMDRFEQPPGIRNGNDSNEAMQRSGSRFGAIFDDHRPGRRITGVDFNGAPRRASKLGLGALLRDFVGGARINRSARPVLLGVGECGRNRLRNRLA